MKGRFGKLKLASAFVISRIIPYHRTNLKHSRQSKTSSFRFLNDLYRDYKSFKSIHPLNQSKSTKFRIKKQFRRHEKMNNELNSKDSSSIPNQSNSQLALPEPKNEPISPSSAGYSSRRQRLLGFARSTRDTYIPQFAGSVTQIASGVSNRAWGTNDLYDNQGNLVIPKNSSITLFPSYTRQKLDDDQSYVVNVKGWLACPGLMTRKNRLILSLAKQITKYGSNSAVQKLESDKLKQDVGDDSSSSDLESLDSDTISVSSAPVDRPPNSSSSTQSDVDEMIRDRLKAFLARSIPNTKITVSIGSEERIELNKLKTVEVTTDINGHFEADVVVNYLPSVVQAKSSIEETVFSFQDIMFMPIDGIGLISDIDDTVKLTGVIGDKRQLMSNLLLKDVLLWNIPPIVKWYNSLFKDMNICFYYVSNAPWQLFTTIENYFKAVKLPFGSIHMKQYTGNIISSLMEPSSSRKKRALCKILDDFPKKKFICVGDSGEHDLEAYTDLVRMYPGRIIAIYIRFVEDSLSDIDDNRILREIKRIIKENAKIKLLRQKIPTSPIKQKDTTGNQPSAPDIEDLIDLSDLSPSPGLSAEAIERHSKLPPMVPSKPTTFKGNKVGRKPPIPDRERSPTTPNLTTSSLDSASHSRPPPPRPRRTVTNSEINSRYASSNESLSKEEHEEKPPPLPSRTSTLSSNLDHFDDFDVYDKLQNVYHVNNFDELELMDRKGAQWLTRVVDSLEHMKDENIEFHVFADDDEEFYENALQVASKYIRS